LVAAALLALQVQPLVLPVPLRLVLVQAVASAECWPDYFNKETWKTFLTTNFSK
jgi:hypothetical protein